MISISHNFACTLDSNKLFLAYKKDNIFMGHLGKLKWRFNDFLVTMVTNKRFSLESYSQGLIYILGTVPTYGMFPHNFPKMLSSIGI